MGYTILEYAKHSPTTISLASGGSHPTAGNNITDVYIGFADKDGNITNNTGKDVSYYLDPQADWLTLTLNKKDSTAYQINLMYNPNNSAERSTKLILRNNSGNPYWNNITIKQDGTSSGGGTSTGSTVMLSFQLDTGSVQTYSISNYSYSLSVSGTVTMNGSTISSGGTYTCGSAQFNLSSGASITIQNVRKTNSGMTGGNLSSWRIAKSDGSSTSSVISTAGTYIIYLTLSN